MEMLNSLEPSLAQWTPPKPNSLYLQEQPVKKQKAAQKLGAPEYSAPSLCDLTNLRPKLHKRLSQKKK